MSLIERSLCQINENVATAVIVIVFLISFFVFRYIAKRSDNKTEIEKRERMKEAEDYFNRHYAETKEFFN